MNEATLQFARIHENDDIQQLALKGCKDENVDLPAALQQIEGRQKAHDKLPEWYAHPGILYPKAVSLEQCSSSVTAHYKSTLIEGDTLIDLSGGFGVDTFAFARHFKQCHYVEPCAELNELAIHNAVELGLQNITFHAATMEETLPSLPSVDYLYIDPSRRDAHGNRVVTLEDCTPNLLLWKAQLLQKATKGILVKLSPMIDLKRTLRQLPETVAIHVIAVNNDCKEVLFLLQSQNPKTDVPVTTINIHNEEREVFQFTLNEEESACPTLAESVKEYLYEPNVAILKAGAFKSIAAHYHLDKLHPHSHLYTSERLTSSFPGRVFRLDNVVPYNKKAASQLNCAKANIATRNFPLSAEELKKTLKIKDGGDIYLFGTTLCGEKKVILKTSKI